MVGGVEMTAKYAGRIINGQPTFLGSVVLPENADITILVDMSPADMGDAPSATQKAAIRFLSSVDEINRDGFGAEDAESFERWDSGEYRLLFNRGLDA
jgi:hypothetical protein